VIKLQHIDSSDKQFFVAAIVAPIAAWWFFVGRKKYSVKGMK
jgi:hypothetical protein